MSGGEDEQVGFKLDSPLQWTEMSFSKKAHGSELSTLKPWRFRRREDSSSGWLENLVPLIQQGMQGLLS